MITDEDRARLGDLAMRAIDNIIEWYGEDATLEDAVLIFEVSRPDEEHGGETCTELNAECTTHRAIIAGGMAAAYANLQLTAWTGGDE